MGLDVAARDASLVAREVFSAGGLTYTWGDIAAAARLWGEWAELEAAARAGLSALAELHARGEEIDARELDDAAVAFRYARDLLSGDEMEEWLARWDLDAVEWSEWLSRGLARERVALPSAVASAGAVDDDLVETAAGVEAICSGALARWAEELAARAAVALASGLTPGSEDTPPAPPARGVLALSSADWNAAVSRVAWLATPCDVLLADAVTETELAHELDRHRLDWVRLDLRRMRFDREQAAREAVLCLRDDGRAPEWVAAVARAALVEERLVLEDAPAWLQPVLLGALPDDVLGPFERDGAYEVLLVAERRAPALEDAAVAGRARRRVVDRAVRREVDRRVRWHEHA